MESWFERNLSLLKERQGSLAEALSLFAPQPLDSGEGFKFSFQGQDDSVLLEPGPQGQPYLKLKDSRGERRLSSALNPQGEDRALVEKFFQTQSAPLSGLTVLGLGLGYHLELALEKLPPKAPILAIEARAELASAALTARDFSKILSRPNFTLSVGPQRGLPPEAPPNVLARPTNLRLDAENYPSQTPRPTPGPSPAPTPGPAPGPAPKAFKPPRILFFDTAYFLSQEIQNAAKGLGAPLSVWKATLGETANESDYARLLNQIKTFRPELVLTVNHLGFDAQGLLADTLRRLGIPMASWFVDSPLFILGAAKRPTSDFFTFCWDQDYLEVLKSLGYHPAAYLPLASDPKFFFPNKKNQPPKPIVSFVGDSLEAATHKYLALSKLAQKDLPTIDALANEFLSNDRLVPNLDGPNDLAHNLGRNLAHNLTHEQKLNLSALITWRASRLYRLKILSNMPQDLLRVNGDAAYRELLPGVKLSGRLNYYQELSDNYQGAAINLNVTSAQMKTGLNQRVFDVPASGAFLLTDRRSQIHNLFDPDEIATYQDPIDAADQARFYLKKPELRSRIAHKAYQRVIRDHLYVHRLSKLAKTVMGKKP
ncbi:MAG: glycosyltransferase [Deltaproteobacteria bacterium]|jgi:spore maturation protein CgeB|nr:glycosyltransferase [Deltaproteobacteria bacterium]